MNPNRPDQISLALGIKTLNTQQHHGRTSVAGNCEVGMEIMVLRDNRRFRRSAPFPK